VIRRLAFLALFVASTALAAPNITSVTPNSGPAAGGTRVVIKGTGFTNNCIICSPPFAGPSVSFGTAPATEVKFIDATTVEAVAPAHLPGAVVVLVRNLDGSGSAILPDGFTYSGNATDAFDPVLFPIFMPPVHGAFGSEFHTTARVFNKGSLFLLLYGLDTSCYLFDPPHSAFDPQLIVPNIDEQELLTGCSRSVGRVFWITKGGDLAASLRVADVSRSATSHGTEIPVVRARDFSSSPIALLGVPSDPRFRITLRIYSLGPVHAPVVIENFGRPIFLTQGHDIFEPWYAEVSDLPRTMSRVLILPGDAPIWAFITVTNNETQQITTITPN
jgi:hypothetical protein